MIHEWLTRRKYSDAVPVVAEWIEAVVPHGSSVLDAGAGSGHLISLLRDHYDVFGCDIEPGHCELIDLDPDRIACCDFSEGNPFDRTFDVIACLGWLHNDWKHKHAVAEPKESESRDMPLLVEKVAYDALDNDGFLIFDWRGDTPNIESIFRRWHVLNRIDSDLNIFCLAKKWGE